MTDQVIFTGPLSEGELSWWYRRADIFALASDAQWRQDRLWTEGFGMVLLEAAARGLPCLAGNAGGVPDAVGDGAGGILLPPRDQAAWLAALEDLAGDPGKRKALGEKARAWALAGHTWEHRRLEFHRHLVENYRI